MDNDLIQDTNLDLLQVQVASVEYTGQAPINVDNQEHIISLDQSALSSKLDTSAFNEWTATHSGTEYSAGDGIDITDHVISVTGQLTGDYLTKASADTLYYPLESNPSGYLTAHQDLSEYAKTDDLSAYQPVGDYYSASNPSGFITGVDLSEYYKKNETSSKEEISSVVNEINNTITNLSSKYYPLNSNPSGYLTAHQDISDKLDVTAFTSYTATAQGTEYTAGENINITNHVISGKDWTSTIESATTGKLDASAFNSGDFYPMTGNPSGFITGVDLTPYQEKTGMTAYQPVGDYYSASNPSGFITGVDLSNYYQKNETSSKEEIDAAFEALSGIDDPYELSAGDGISIVNNTATKKTVISCTGGGAPIDTGAFYPMTGNPSGFLTAHQSLDNYYTKDDTSSKQEIAAALSTAGQQLTPIEPVYINTANEIGTWIWTLTPGYGIRFTENSASCETVIEVTGVPTAFTGDYLPLSAKQAEVGEQVHASAIGLAQGAQVSARDYSFAQGHMVSALHIASVQGLSATAYDCAMAQGFEVSARQCAFAQGAQTTADYCSLAQGGHCSAWSASIAQGEYNTASLYSQAFGDHTRADDHTMAIGAYNKTSANTPFVIGNGTSEANRSDLFIINSTGGVSAAGKISANGVELGAGGGSNIHWYVDTPNEHTSADIDLTIQTTASLGGGYDRNLLDGNGNFIGALIPSAASEDLGKVLTITAGSPRWQNLPETPSGAYGIKTEVVANSGLATGQNILYIVTGN